ncbi:ABC-type transport system, involved in lipoprotein release, permease component [Chitinophaga sp. YR573]|uniref:ABC transporter permease n=1 Tax=Chitinophaga sp. YR573 TaxID=1881040 RepID=UPI0008C9D338|nr:ABC transporter permease [Chitinophaga sp. YR573]SEW37643.1 ABC-type transport system, involved in lipoprotein release, permease component [Chitinophaga sp. YR573]
MLRNYIKIAWRNLIRNKAFSLINISGLALGLTCSLLILLWVQDERSIDGFHANGDQLFQVYERRSYDGKTEANYLTQGLLAEELKKAIPEVEYASSMEQNNQYTFEAEDKVFKVDGTFASVDFLRMFSYPLLQGTLSNGPNTISISRKMAEQFFGSAEQAIGKIIRYENKDDLQVTAVFENLPANSSQQFDFLRNWQDYARDNEWVHSWTSTGPSTFIQLRKDADAAKTADKIKRFIAKYDQYTELYLQPYREKYLHSNFKNGEIDGGRIEYVHLFSLVALFILLIACINFMNLATARSTQRAKEVGVRKVVGAVRSSLIAQFVGEAILITFISVIIAILLVVLLLPVFNNFTGKHLVLPVTQPLFWLTLLGILIFTGFTAGSYPALFLSSLNPLRVLKGSLKLGTGATFFRKSLVVFQFSFSVILIVGMIIIYRQINYVQTKNLGYDRENLLYIPIEGDLITKYDLFKKEAAQMPGILSISKMRESPTVIGHQKGGIGWEGKDPTLEVSFSDAAVGYDFVKTMRLTLVAGRDFSEDFGTDANAFLVNETAVKKMGYKDPVGKPFSWSEHNGNIIGVLKDFHFNSMHQAIEPLFVRLDLNPKWGTILVRTSNAKQALASLENICKTLNPKFPFIYHFSDQEFDKLYKSEQIVSKLTVYFAFLAIFISCLGLFGLATFAAAQRTKEIGVRKVLGASVPDIITLLSADILKPVAIALLIGFPVSWYVMNQWLQGFAYKTDIEWWMFVLAAILTIGIAILTVSFQSVKAALMNPVKSLKAD